MEFDFTTNQSLEDISVVPEQFRGAYAQGTDGVYAISETSKGLVDAISGLSKSLKAARRDAAQKGAKVDFSQLADFGDFQDLDGVKAHLTDLQSQLAAAAGGKVNLDKMKADMEKAFATKEQGYKDGSAKMQRTLEKYLIESTAVGALAANKGNAALLLPHVKNRVKVVEDGEDYVVRVLDDAGDFRGDGKGGFMTIADLVTEMKSHKDFAAAFESEAPRGSGAKPGTMERSAGQRQATGADATPHDRIRAGLAKRRR